MIFENQLVPFEEGRGQEFKAETDRHEPPELESSEMIVLKGVLGQNDGEAARQQANCRDNRKFQNILGIGTGYAAADVDQVSGDKDRKQRRFGNDQKNDADGAAIRQFPLALER